MGLGSGGDPGARAISGQTESTKFVMSYELIGKR